MSKTPFEIRLDLLTMAQSVLTENLASERSRIEQDWYAQREFSVIAAQKGNVTPTIPPFPILPTLSEDEIIRTAKKLNDFVSNVTASE